MSQSVSRLPVSRRHRLAAVLAGLVVPAGAFGSAMVLAVAIAALVASVAVPDRGRHARRVALTALFHPLGLLCLAMLLLWLPNVFASPERLETAKTWVRVAVVLAGSVYLFSVIDRNAELSALARDSLLVGLTVVLVFSLTAIFAAPELVTSLRRSYLGPWLRYKAFASTLACTAPLLLWMAWEHAGWRRIAAGLSLVLSAVMVIGTGSRASVAGLAAAAVIALIFLALRKPRLRLPVLAAAGVVVVAVVAFLLHLGGRHAEDTGALGLPLWLIDIHRQHIWAFVIERLQENLWFGHGLNAIAHIPGADHLIPGVDLAYVPSHPHNWMLEMLAEAGVLGFAPAAALVALLIGRDAAATAKAGAPRRAARLMLLIAFWVSACFNFSIWAPWWGVTLCFLYLIVSARPEIPAAGPRRMLFA
ncbi:MAG: O-antigen ligase family protein, partial [Rhodospirillaceae bacterium]